VIQTIRQFAKTDFLPFCRSTFAAKTKTLGYYENGAARLLEFSPVADESLDTITGEKIAGYARRRQDMGMTVSTVNRELQVLRRMFALAVEWEKWRGSCPACE
jgi:site-specific recombinase XerD